MMLSSEQECANAQTVLTKTKFWHQIGVDQDVIDETGDSVWCLKWLQDQNMYLMNYEVNFSDCNEIVLGKRLPPGSWNCYKSKNAHCKHIGFKIHEEQLITVLKIERGKR